MDDKKVIGRIAIVAIVVAFLFWNPYTRAAILWILPLGSGVDDFIVMAAALGAAIFGSFWVMHKRREGLK